jgi:hypothetical protein
MRQHPVILHLRAELGRHRGVYPILAKRAGLTTRSLHALSQGTMHEMTGSRELCLAEALGYEVVLRAKKRGSQRFPVAASEPTRS